MTTRTVETHSPTAEDPVTTRRPPPLELPQFAVDKARRAADVAAAAKHYRYDRDNPLTRAMPPWMAKVPAPETRRRTHYPALGRLTEIGAKLWSYRLSMPPRLRRWMRGEAARAPFALYHELFRGHEVPWVARGDVWKTDEAFGYQRLVGMTPVYLEAVREVPAEFKVRDADVQRAPAWPPGATLADMIAARRLWMVRHTRTHGVEAKPRAVMCSPHCLFLVRDDGKLVPVAIQLFVDSDVVFTPADDVDEAGARTHRWLVAKMFCANVDALMYTLYTHSVLTHLVVETMWAAMCRTLHASHPVRAMLAPHTEVTHLIGHLFRGYYTRPDGELARLHQASFDGLWELLRRCYADWSFADLDIPELHRRRGWDTADQPPNFYFRDDTRRHHEMIRRYCERVCEAIYPEERWVAEDRELQAWARELADPARGCGLRGLPTDPDGGVSTRAQLVKLLAGLIYQAVVQHNHVDNAGHTYFSFAPNMPLSLYLDPPRDHCVRYTEAQISDALPPLDDALLQFALPQANHPFHPQPRHRVFDSVVAEFPDDFMTGLPSESREKVRDAVAEWRRDLAAYADVQEARNRTLWTAPYDFLNARFMSNSIWY